MRISNPAFFPFSGIILKCILSILAEGLQWDWALVTPQYTLYLFFFPSLTSFLPHRVFWNNLPDNSYLKICFLGNQN